MVCLSLRGGFDRVIKKFVGKKERKGMEQSQKINRPINSLLSDLSDQTSYGA
jgi:hypothetical protein